MFKASNKYTKVLICSKFQINKQEQRSSCFLLTLKTLSKLIKLFFVHQIFACSKSTTETVEKGVKLFKVNNKKARERRGYFIDNFEHISPLLLEFLLLTLNK